MNIFFQNSSRKGFTLIELLVVISIIGALSAVIFPRFGVMREKARDTERMTDVRQIQNALEQFFNQESRYPNNLTELSTFMPELSVVDPAGDYYTYTRDGSCTVGNSSYSLEFEAENPNTFTDDTTVTLNGSTVCIDLFRSN